MRGNGGVAVAGAVVRMSIGTIPHCLVFDLQGYITRCPLHYVPYWLQIQPCLSIVGDGVRPSESSESASTSSLIRNSSATASCPFSAAHDNGVWPALYTAGSSHLVIFVRLRTVHPQSTSRTPEGFCVAALLLA